MSRMKFFPNQIGIFVVVVVVNGLDDELDCVTGFCTTTVVVIIGGFCVIVGGGLHQVVEGTLCVVGLGVVVEPELSDHMDGVVGTVNGGSMVVVCNGSYCISSM